ncbi:MAG: LysM peptidoglycan-binding domain-containing protein [Firmicutes bacterium]|nr:LysM peptidoglycan-binding domain-containing protein [Bacillota bacterium]
MFESYRLEKNEDLYSVAKKYNTTVKTLQDINNIYFLDAVREGMEIVVPTESKDYFNYYVVEQGDSLYAIARRYNINPELLASMNGLNLEDYIYPNQQLLIPKNGYSYYITAEGDTLDEVVKVFNSNNDKFLNENKTIYLMAGQLLVNKK